MCPSWKREMRNLPEKAFASGSVTVHAGGVLAREVDYAGAELGAACCVLVLEHCRGLCALWLHNSNSKAGSSADAM